MANLPQDKQDELVIKITEVLLKRIFLEIMEKMDEQGKEEYQKLAEGGNATPEQMEDFLKSKVEDFEGLVQKVIDEFKEEMKQGINY